MATAGDEDRRAHWDHVHTTRAETDVSWFEETPAVSLDLIRATGIARDAAIIDIGGGASRLVDALLQEGYSALTVLDVAEPALATARARLGSRASAVRWIVADVTAWAPDRTYAVWHDRAAFHFLTRTAEREAYVARVLRALPAGGHLIIGTFAPDGPERCSGLPVLRYDAASLAATLGRGFALVDTRPHEHHTPAGTVQRFQFSRFRRV
ncbi:MAG TPA: class I SAM-dependent methyltransferase [Acetobacteraceae bacterium]|nr:class I SAM-dependent methyltransferase [Acetobacteraceae bacterium]